MVKIRIMPGLEATIEGYHWTCDNPAFEKVLNNMLSSCGPSGSDPNPDLTAARKAVERYGAEILYADHRNYEGDEPGVVY